MVNDIRLRAACDRCQKQKLKCPRALGQEKCVRCISANASCHFSPFRQKKDPLGEHSERCASVLSSPAHDSGGDSADKSYTAANHGKRKRTDFNLGDITLALNLSEAFCVPGTADISGVDDLPPFEWMNDISLPSVPPILAPEADWDFDMRSPYFDFTAIPYLSQLNPTPGTDLVLCAKSSLSSSTPTLDSSDTLSAPHAPSSQTTPSSVFEQWEKDLYVRQLPGPATLIRQLSDLSVTLYEHRSTIPPLSIYDHIDFAEFGSQCSAADGDTKQYRPDETFRLTQDLIDIYPSFINIFLGAETALSGSPSPEFRESITPDCITAHSATHLAIPRPSSTSTTSVDHPSVLLILSCHLRLMDIYDELLTHMKLCMVQRREVHVAKMKIGSYVLALPQPADVPLQMLLLIQLVSRLVELATDLLGALEERVGKGKEKEGDVREAALSASLLTAETAKGRSTNLSQQVHLLAGQLLEHGFGAECI